jgi:acetyltransferase-like isoleucine patch superfamily enzyme
MELPKEIRNRISFFLRNPILFFLLKLLRIFPYFDFLFKTQDYQGRISFQFWFKQKILNLGGNRGAYWPVHSTSDVSNPERIIIGIDAYPGLMRGCYIQGRGGIKIGDYTQIGPNVVIISANHDPYDSRRHIPKPVIIGKYCWIAAGAKVMPGVHLGDFTIVGAGAVVTQSFPEGFCVIAGVPAKKIKSLDSDDCVQYSTKHKFYGYLNASRFLKRNQRCSSFVDSVP